MKIDRRYIFNKYGGRCSYCGQVIEFKKFQVDHMYPLRQGHHYKTNKNIDVNDIENLMPACRKCNHYKRGGTLEAFRNSMKSLHKRLANIYILEVAVNFGIAEYKPWNGVFYFETVANNIPKQLTLTS